MDHLSFIFSLLLIVSVTTTTLGSAIKTKNPNGGELEALLERSNYSRMNSRDEDSEMQNRLDPSAVIDGVALGISVLKDLLGAIGSVHRKIAIGIDDESGYEWKRPTNYFFSGTSDQNLPYHLSNGFAMLYPARKSKGPVARGVLGAVAFYVPKIQSTVAVMFSVPYDYNLYQNWWNVKLYKGKPRASCAMFNDMYYYANPFRANGWHERDLGSHLKFRGIMSNAGTSTLEIHVLKK